MIEHTIPVAIRKTNRNPKAEHRVWVRYATCEEVYCQPITVLKGRKTRTSWLGRLRNVSSRGLALRLSQRVKPGAMLVIEVSSNANGAPRYFPVRVVHATAEGNGLWIMGCEFFCPLSEEDLPTLVGK